MQDVLGWLSRHEREQTDGKRDVRIIYARATMALEARFGNNRRAIWYWINEKDQ